MTILNLAGSAFAFVLGTFANDNDAILLQLMFFVIYNLGSGVFANLNKCNWFIWYCQYFSPYRYAVEVMLRLILRGHK